ncbi:excalibur calcium-binding domain-containing protein [Mycobacteroides chelonae]
MKDAPRGRYGALRVRHERSPATSKGDPGYRPKLDRDNDGVACERYAR